MQVATIGVDLAKNVCQVHGITATEEVVFNKPLRLAQFLTFFAKLKTALMELITLPTLEPTRPLAIR